MFVRDRQLSNQQNDRLTDLVFICALQIQNLLLLFQQIFLLS